MVYKKQKLRKVKTNENLHSKNIRRYLYSSLVIILAIIPIVYLYIDNQPKITLTPKISAQYQAIYTLTNTNNYEINNIKLSAQINYIYANDTNYFYFPQTIYPYGIVPEDEQYIKSKIYPIHSLESEGKTLVTFDMKEFLFKHFGDVTKRASSINIRIFYDFEPPFYYREVKFKYIDFYCILRNGYLQCEDI